MHHAKSNHDIRAGSVADGNDVLDPQLVKDGDQVLAQVLHCWVCKVGWKIFSIVFLSWQVDVDKDGAFLDFFERIVLDEAFPFSMVAANVMN